MIEAESIHFLKRTVDRNMEATAYFTYDNIINLNYTRVIQS